MTNVRETALEYEPTTTKVVSDLKSFNILNDLHKFEGEDKDGKKFAYNYVEVEGERYRVPASVLEQTKLILEDNPDILEVKVKKTGEGLNTKYHVTPLK